MQNIAVAGQTCAADSLTRVVFLGATATVADGVLELESLKGVTRDVVNGHDGTDPAFQAVIIGDSEWTAGNITNVELAEQMQHSTALLFEPLASRAIRALPRPLQRPWC